jgi:hypothetical protein
MPRFVAFLLPLILSLSVIHAQSPQPVYVKHATRNETILAILRTMKLPTLEGKWHYIGPFDNSEKRGFDFAYPPEREIDLTKRYRGKYDEVGWKEFSKFGIGRMNNLALFANNDEACIYVFHEIVVAEPRVLPLSLGSDDTLSVWLNGERLIHENVERAAAPDQNQASLRLKKGKNQLLIKVCNAAGPWELYVCPELPASVPEAVRVQLDRDFPPSPRINDTSSVTAEARHYRMETVKLPVDCVLEVGGLAFRADGKLLACTRRGEVWLISYPDISEKTEFKLFANGLHEALGLVAENDKSIVVVQRPELTRITDKDGDDVADEYQTICDRWGVSGDYHEFAFGPARDKDGNFYVTLNVGFGGGHQSKAPWRGWCVKVTPKGDLQPIAVGLRSPNGINFSPHGDLFYTDNQGEWVATNKMHQIHPGEFYGHPAGLRWVKDSPFASVLSDRVDSGMHYDGGAGPWGKTGMPQLTPPCIWFPYGRMGQSASEPRWDTTEGKFGPFAGQCFVGDQTTSVVMRVALEKVKGKYQGACFPFRSGFQCGINRLVFAPDGSLYAGQTNRGWGSRGGMPYGLQRLVYTGVPPFEIHTIKLTKTGFDLAFTKPVNQALARALDAFELKSFTYNYWSTYGSPEVDQRAEKVEAVDVSADRKTVSLSVSGLKPGRVYELRLNGLKSADGTPVLHPEAYYTLNELP